MYLKVGARNSNVLTGNKTPCNILTGYDSGEGKML